MGIVGTDIKKSIKMAVFHKKGERNVKRFKEKIIKKLNLKRNIVQLCNLQNNVFYPSINATNREISSGRVNIEQFPSELYIFWSTFYMESKNLTSK